MKSEFTTLKGITWNHTRGYVPLVATSQRYQERGGATIVWEKRSLRAFGEQPLAEVAAHYDLLIIDHPFIGDAASSELLVPLDEHLTSEFLADQAANTVGASFASYRAMGHQWALAVDTAAPVASYRHDILEHHGLQLPHTWDELIDLARAGFVTMPATRVDSLMTLYSLADGLGVNLFDGESALDAGGGEHALALLQDLITACGTECLDRNPIGTYELLAGDSRFAYCPFAFSYTNYGRQGFGPHLVSFTDVISLRNGPLRTTLGGAGIAISRSTRHLDEAAAYVEFVCRNTTQAGIYLECGGQPGHRAAWLARRSDVLTNGFFGSTLATHDRAYLRPRYQGYGKFQDLASTLVRNFLKGESSAKQTIEEINRSYANSLPLSTDLVESELNGRSAR